MNKTSFGLPIKARRIIAYVVLVLISVMCLIWFYLLFVNSSRSNASVSSGVAFLPSNQFGTNIKNVMNDSSVPLLKGLLNSFIVAALNATFSVYFSTMTAYAIHVYDFKGKQAIFTFILMIMMIPTQVTVLGFLKWIDTLRELNKSIVSIFSGMGGFYTVLRSFAKGGNYADYVWLILPGIAAPVTFYYLKQYMESALPLSLVEAARIDGSSEIRTFNEISLPLMRPAIAVQAIFAFVASWNNYFVPSHILIDSPKTVPILLAMLRSADYQNFDMGKIYMSIFIAIFPVIVVYLILSKNIVGGIAVGSVKG